MHHLHQPDQGHHLHQLQTEPEQQIQPQHLATGIAQHPLHLLQWWVAIWHRPLRPLGIGRQAPAAEQGGCRGNCAGDLTHAQVAAAAVGEHHRGHDQAAQARQD